MENVTAGTQPALPDVMYSVQIEELDGARRSWRCEISAPTVETAISAAARKLFGLRSSFKNGVFYATRWQDEGLRFEPVTKKCTVQVRNGDAPSAG